MNKPSKIGLILLAACFFSQVSFAYNEMAGTNSGSFMKLSSGVRAAGMGGAFTSVSDDTSGMYWNPAGLAQITSVEVSSEYANWPAGISFSNISCIFPGKKAAAGLSIDYLNMGGIEETTLAQPYGTGNTINPSALNITASIARKTKYNICLGGSFKLLNDIIGADTVSGFAADAGILWKPDKHLSLGFSAKNAFGYLGKEPVYSSYNIGASLADGIYLLALDINIPSDNKMKARLGTEINVRNMLFLRAGLDTHTDTGSAANLSGGVGIRIKDLIFDYAYVPVSEIGSSHRFSVSIFLNTKAKRPKPATEKARLMKR